MRSVACHILVSFTVWTSLLSPAGAQYPGDGREIAESVIYRFGQQMFVDTFATETERSGMIPAEDMAPPQAAEPDLVGSAFSDSDDHDLLSDAVE